MRDRLESARAVRPSELCGGGLRLCGRTNTDLKSGVDGQLHILRRDAAANEIAEIAIRLI